MSARRWIQVAVAVLGLALIRWALLDPPAGAPPRADRQGPVATEPAPSTPAPSIGPAAGEGAEALPVGPPDRTGAATSSGLRVVVSAAGRALAGAEVRIFRRATHPVGWQEAGAGATGADGALLTAAPPGEYLIAAAAAGLARGHLQLTRPAGEPLTEARLELSPGSPLLGRTVERRRREPVPLASITLTPVAGPPRGRALPLPEAAGLVTTSDERGLFRVDHLAPGRWRLEARAVGHAPALADLAVPRAGELLVELASTAAIEGRVTRGGAPVAGATVRITGAGASLQIQSGDRGGFAAEVDPGTHHLVAEAGGATGSAGRAVQVAAGQTLRGVELVLGPPSSIAGTVVDARGPVTGALVTAAPYREAGALASATTGEDGAFLLSPLAAGTWAVTASQGARVASGLPGVVLPAAARFHLDVTLPAPTAVEGTVSDDAGPVAGALVTAAGGWPRRDGAGPGGGPAPSATSARTDPAGRYRLDGVATGRLRLTARRDERSPVSLGSVDVEAGETAHADLVLVSGGLVAGTVREADGTPVPGALVAALDAGPGQGQPGMGLRPTTADADGAYLLPLAAGSHGLTALRPEEAGGRLGRPKVLASVEVTVGQRSDLDLVLPPRPAATLVGLVLEPGGAPSVGATVWTGGAGAGLQLVTADGEGRFTLAAPGSDPVTVRSRNGGRAATLTTTPPQPGLVVQLLPAATIQGALVGDPAPETFELTSTVRGLPFGGPPTQLQFGGSAFLLEDQLPGEVALHVRTSDGRIGDVTTTVAAAETAPVAVTLSSAATVTGRLVDAATGAPVTRARLLLDGQPTRRGAVGADGRFSRVMGVGPHTLTAQAAGYQPLAASVTARSEAPIDLGDLALTPVAATPAGPTGPSGPGAGR